MDYYVIRRTETEGPVFAAIDMDSGGYPWWTDDLDSAKFFRSAEEAYLYKNSFAGECDFHMKGALVFKIILGMIYVGPPEAAIDEEL